MAGRRHEERAGRGRALAGAILLLLLGAGLAGATRESRSRSDDVVKRWETGPVRYLMSGKEEAALRNVKSIDELARFISDFWARRDPTPGTLENEFRHTYWERVLEANRRFRDSTIPGWKTDRGKVFILLGEPIQIEADESPSVAAGPSQTRAPDRDPGIRGIERWTYRRQYSKTAEPEFVVAFVRDESLDWKLSSNPELLKPDFPGVNTLDSSNPTFGGIENRSAQVQNQGAAAAGSTTTRDSIAQQVQAGSPPAFDTSVFANYDLGLEASVPSNPEQVLALVTARGFVTAFAAAPAFEFFRARDGATFVNVGGLIRAADLYGTAATGVSTLRLHVSLAPAAAPGGTRYTSNENAPATFDLSKGADPAGIVDVWTGLAVPAGRYSATLAVEDTLTGRIGRASAEVEVPDFSSPGLALSSLVLGTSLSETGERLGLSARSSGAFRKSEEFALYYEVYGAATGEGGVRFDATYRFYLDGEGPPRPIGKPIPMSERTEAVQGWSFPLEKWPTGRYRIEVVVTDASGRTVTAQTPFQVLD